MSNKKPVIFWIAIAIFTPGIIEAAASVFYFQRGPYDSSFAVVQIWDSLKKRISRSGVLKSKAIHIHVNDDRFGWTLKSNLNLVVDCPNTKPTYTTDSNKERFIPKPKDPVGRILFLGGGITFGHCVSDNELYPSILATEYWKNWEVHNKSVSGWGTTQAYMVLSDAIKRDSLPSMVIYGMTPHHIKRNFLRKTWFFNQSRKGRKHPYFELVNDNLVFQGTVGLSSGIEDGPGLRKKEHEITFGFLSAMHQMCAKMNIPFIVVFLPPSGWYPLPLINRLYESNVLGLDLTEIEYEGIDPGKYNNINPIGHRMIATAIANSFVSNILVNIENSVK